MYRTDPNMSPKSLIPELQALGLVQTSSVQSFNISFKPHFANHSDKINTIFYVYGQLSPNIQTFLLFPSPHYSPIGQDLFVLSLARPFIKMHVD